jgi:uroporphyrin-III C-methyltransferase
MHPWSSRGGVQCLNFDCVEFPFQAYRRQVDGVKVLVLADGLTHSFPMNSTLPNMPVFEPGWVWLVGAGPGDPGLLTLHAVNAMKQADVVVYDALVSPQILDMAPDGAHLEYAGKRGGKPSAKQRDISLRLVEFAQDGKRVCRLKGGDPFVFGRGGEEALTLVEHEIPFRIVPGISAGIGGLAYAGIPVTHRDTNHNVTFLTGHDAGGVVPDAIDWESIAKGSPVIVMYMAMKHIDSIARKLLSAGRSAEEPLAIVCNATTVDMQVHETTLGNVGDLDVLGLAPPAIVVLGEVVKMRSGLDWLGAMEGRILNKDPLGTRRISKSA